MFYYHVIILSKLSFRRREGINVKRSDLESLLCVSLVIENELGHNFGSIVQLPILSPDKECKVM